MNIKKSTNKIVQFVMACTTVLLAVILMAGIAMAVDLTIPCSLTVNIPENYKDDLKAQELTVDLYKVADVSVEDSSFKIVVTSDFSSISSQINEAGDKDSWDAAAQAAVSIVSKAGNMKPEISGKGGTKIEEIEAGIYLVLVHQNNSGYFTTIDGSIRTTGATSNYNYYFIPQLITFPLKETDEDYFNTADDTNPWVYDAVIEPKIGREKISVPDETTTPTTTPPETTPAYNPPKTNDTNNLIPYIVIMAAATMIIVVMIIVRIQRKRDNDSSEND